MEAETATPRELASRMVKRARLATIPETLQEARRLVDDPDSTLSQLGEVFGRDPAMSAHLLRVANSAFYGLRAEVRSIDHAAALLGRKVLRNVALAASMQTIMHKVNASRGDLVNELWRHSIRTAAASAALARELEVWEPEEAFTAGLMHDVGVLVEFEHDYEGLVEKLREQRGLDGARREGSLLALESRHFGVSHQECGGVLCETWGFPETLAAVVAHHHDPMAVEAPARTLACLVHIAEHLTDSVEHGVSDSPWEPLVDPESLVYLDIEPEGLEDLADSLALAAEEVELAFRA